MKRPGQWDLLGYDSDPLDADSPEVASRAKHYSDVADLITTQTARLKAIGSGDNSLVGKYASALEQKSGDLAGQLEKTHQRYAAVGSALATYHPALDTALTETMGALTDAVNAHAAQQSANSMPQATADPGKQLTDDQKTANSKRSGAIDAANDELAAAKKRLSDALSDLNDAAKSAAGTIHDALNDGLSDSFWDKFMNFLVEFVKVLVDIAGWIAIACAIVMLFIPGLDILATIALAATIASLVGHTFLAATGNGSWMDVALDIVALATFGLGKLGTSGLRATEEATTEAGTRAAGNSQRAFNRELSSLNRRIASGTGKARVAAIQERAALRARPIRASELTNQIQSAKSTVGIRQSLQFGGDLEGAKSLAAIRRVQTIMQNSGGVTQAAAGAGKYTTIARTGWSSGLAVAGTDKGLSQSEIVKGYHGNEGYNQFKEHFTHQVVAW